MTFTVFACETVTGLNIGPLDCQLGSWARVLNGSETAAVTLKRDEAHGLSARTRDDFRQKVTPARMSLVIDWDGIPLWAGPIWNTSRAASSVAVSASGLLNVFTRRKAIDPLSATPYASQTLSYTGLSLGTIAKRLVQFSLARTGGTLPIVFQGDESGAAASHDRTYLGSDLGTIADLLGNLTGVEGGPDIDFRPQWVDSNRSAIQWAMLFGTQASPLLTSGNEITWDASAPQSSVKDIAVKEDASAMATDEWSKGAGSDADTLISHASSSTYIDLGWPLLENEADYTTVTDQGTLDAHAAGDLTAYGQATEQWDMSVDALADPQLGSYELGDLASVHVQDDWWLPDGDYGMRIVGYSGDASMTVKLALQGTDVRGVDVLGSADQTLSARISRLERGTS